MAILFFDIETILDDNITDIDYLREKHWESFDFLPEFHSVLTICIGKIELDGSIVTKSLSGTEKEMIEEFFSLTEYTQGKWLISQTLCGFNIKWFDIPFIVKRAIYHGVSIPESLKLFGKKPWDMENMLDLYEVYKHTGYKSGSLDTICKFLSIPTPKQWIDGSQVQKFHDEWKDDEIVTYCLHDVEATIRVYEKFKALNLI